MSRRALKLGAVCLGVGGPGRHDTWLHPEIPGDASVDIDFSIARARQAEAAKFDLVFIVDSQFVTENSPNHYLSRLEPLAPLSAPRPKRGTLRGNLGLPVPENRYTAARHPVPQVTEATTDIPALAP